MKNIKQINLLWQVVVFTVMAVVPALSAQEPQELTSLEELAPKYFAENKYNEFVDSLKGEKFGKDKSAAEVNYYTGLARFNQLKYLEETQNWDEYFSMGNSYRDDITSSLKKSIDSLGKAAIYGLYSRLLLWRFHHAQQDAMREDALNDLINYAIGYAETAKDYAPLKETADRLKENGEKAKAKQIYRVYVEKILASDVNEDQLFQDAEVLFKEQNLDLAEAFYDAYTEKVAKTMPKDKLAQALTEIAKKFAYSDGLQSCDPEYAEKMFKKIEEITAGKVFDEELMYLRAFNLEKDRQYLGAGRFYSELVKQYPQSSHVDEADFKTGLIITYAARSPQAGKVYFERLAAKDALSPQVISALYQLGLINQWENNLEKAQQYYNQLMERAKDGFADSIRLAKERIKEINEGRPLEYNLKMFLDVSFKPEFASMDMTKIEARATPFKTIPEKEINVNSSVYAAQSGCLQAELQYLWSGNLGGAAPSITDSTFATSYSHPGTKEVNLVVVSANGVVDRNLGLIDIELSSAQKDTP